MSKTNPFKILIVQLVSNGDCLMATTIARQIKLDFPNSELTWAISYKCKQVIINNPYVDKIWEVNYDENSSHFSGAWYRIKNDVSSMSYDRIFFTQIYPENESNYDGTTRSSLFKSYPRITVPIQPTVRLCDKEVENVKAFIKNYQIENYSHKVIFECTPSSNQSPLSLETGLIISQKLVEKIDSLIVVISTHLNFKSPHPRIINGSELTYRENAELSKYCSFLIGCSSGISWLLTSDWAKKLPTIQIIDGNAFGFRFASMKYDFKYWGLDTNHIIETDISDDQDIFNLIEFAINNFENAKVKYDKDFKPNIDYCCHLMVSYFKKGEIVNFMRVYTNFGKRNGVWFKTLFVFFKTIFRKSK
jgi:hypothetical protein